MLKDVLTPVVISEIIVVVAILIGIAANVSTISSHLPGVF